MAASSAARRSARIPNRGVNLSVISGLVRKGMEQLVVGGKSP